MMAATPVAAVRVEENPAKVHMTLSFYAQPGERNSFNTQRHPRSQISLSHSLSLTLSFSLSLSNRLPHSAVSLF